MKLDVEKHLCEGRRCADRLPAVRADLWRICSRDQAQARNDVAQKSTRQGRWDPNPVGVGLLLPAGE